MEADYTKTRSDTRNTKQGSFLRLPYFAPEKANKKKLCSARNHHVMAALAAL